MNVVVPIVALILSLPLSVRAYDDLSVFSDEFDDATSLVRWKSLWQTEGWGANQLLTRDINTSQPGRLVLVPHASTWYRDWRGVLEYKDISGDFVLTTDVEPRRRTGPGAPQSAFSLAGIMVRAPRPGVTNPATWTPGGENYVFLSLGTGDSPGQFQFEVKTTRDSDSVLNLSPGVAKARIQVARIGATFVMLRQNDGGPWIVHQRYTRPDFPPTAQVGLTTYSDWNTASQLEPFQHNQTIIPGGNPDLVAAFEYVRFARPVIPPRLVGRDFSNASSVSDGDLATFLGATANVPGGASSAPTLTLAPAAPPHAGTLECLISGLRPDRSYRIESTTNWVTWTTFNAFVSHAETHPFSLASDTPSRFVRVVSP
jgi:hypothetical protein